MGLSDFERELAETKTKASRDKRDRSRENERHHRDHHRRSNHKRHSDDADDDRECRHRHKRRRGDGQVEDDEERRRRKDERRARRAEYERTERRRDAVPDGDLDDDGGSAPVNADDLGTQADEELDERLVDAEERSIQRDDWMQTPSTLDVDYVQRRQKQPTPPSHAQSTKKDYELKLHQNEPNHQLRDVIPKDAIVDEPAQHEVSYEFGDSGSQWRMTKLKAVYRQAEESGKPLEVVAADRFGSLREFDDAREEEIELDRRNTYGKGYVGKIKPSGELFEERKLSQDIRRKPSNQSPEPLPQGEVMREQASATKTVALDQTALNRLKAQMMKAKIRGGAEAERLESEYTAALAGAANRVDPEVVVLSAMDNRMLAGGRAGEVKSIENKRGREHGLVEENEDMSIEDMVRQERRTKGAAGGSGLAMAERIAKDAKFDNDLDYMDENAEKLSKRVAKSDINLRNMAIGDFRKMQKALESCPLCHHEDRNPPIPPIAPVVSLATRVYLTLPTEPEISDGGAVIVPIQHRLNLLECDDDEWEEMRNFMKCLTRMYHDQGRDVIFYENAAAPYRRHHAALQVVPLPYELGETAPAFFREAMLSADEEWSQHKKIIDTLKRSKEGLGKLAFRRSIAKEMPYFHVWFELDGGMGHVIEDERRWPKGDLFAREILGGMLDVGPEIVKRQGRWHKGDRRKDEFKKRWGKFDWTKVLTDG